MVKKFLNTHHKKIIFGTPIIFLMMLGGEGLLSGGNHFIVSVTAKNFPVVGDEIPVMLDMDAKTPVNAVGGTMVFDPKILNVTSVSRVTSSVDLWSEEPSYSNTDGMLHFSGGIIGEKSTHPLHGTILIVNFQVLSPGKAIVTMKDGELLASNGEGTNVTSGTNVLSIYTRNLGAASPDVNDDGTLSIGDANALYLKTFGAYDPHYDLNGDGKVSFADVRYLISLF